jgi:hypothetical protein
MVVLDSAAVTSLDDAGGIGPHQRNLLRCGGAAAEVGDVGHIDAVGDDELDDGLAEQVAGYGDRDGTDAGNFAQFLAVGPAAAQRFDVDSQQRQIPRILPAARRHRGHRPPATVAKSPGAAVTFSALCVLRVRGFATRRHRGAVRQRSGLAGSGGVLGHSDEGIEGVRLDRFLPAIATCRGEDLVGDGSKDGGEGGAVLGTAVGREVPAAFASV